MNLIAVLLGAIGAVLSVCKNRWCFMVWIFPNAYWIWFNWPGIQSWVFVVMSASCIAGWIAWSINEINRRELVEQNAYFRQGWTQAQDRIIELKKELGKAYICVGKLERAKNAKSEKDEKENDSVDMCRISRAVGMLSDEQQEESGTGTPIHSPGTGRTNDARLFEGRGDGG